MRQLAALLVLLAVPLAAEAPALSDVSALKVENHLLKLQIWQRDADALEQRRGALLAEEQALVETLRVELGADKADTFDWSSKRFRHQPTIAAPDGGVDR